MLPNLFVYGTLMTRAGHPMGVRLARESSFVGTAVIRGRLFDFGRYPALVEQGPDDGAVFGEVHTLNSPASSLKWLDAYEGIVPGREVVSEYERVQRDVRLDGGDDLTVWVYLYRGPVVRGRWVASGCWRELGMTGSPPPQD